MIDIEISLIIRTFNEEKYLPILLKKIQSQSVFGKTEIIIVDSGSTDSTLSIAEKYQAKIVKIPKSIFTFGKSLNLGCSIAKGNFLVIVSAHCIPTNNYWIENLIIPLRKGQCVYSYGRQIGCKKTFFSESEIFRKYYPNKSNFPQKGYFCNNANSAILKSTWQNNKFDENLTGLEDLDLAKKLCILGGKIGYVSEACVHHCHKETWQQISRRFERESYALLKICPEITLNKRNLIFFTFSAIYLDYKKAFGMNLLFKDNNLKDIFLYRCYQFWGSFKGNKITKRLNQEMSNRYFFPNKTFEDISIDSFISPEKSNNKKSTSYPKKIIALLPMKANSNRVKGKNFRNFAGKPLYCWILETLLSIESISEIIINTDAYDILQKNELLNNDKIRLIERPTEICGDEVSMNKIISHDLINSDGDIYLMTHTTNPLLTSNTISSCIDEFLDKTLITDYDSLFTVNEIQTRFYNKKGKPINHNPKKLIPTQDLEKIYEENSNLYIFTKKSFFSTSSRIGKKPILYKSLKQESFDIDIQSDWDIAESMALYKKNLHQESN